MKPPGSKPPGSKPSTRSETPPVRPQIRGSYVSSPSSKICIDLLGGGTVHEGVRLSQTEVDRLRELYGYRVEPPHDRPAPPVAPDRSHYECEYDYQREVKKYEDALRVHERWVDPRGFHQVGADRNMIRHAQCDGLRIVAWLSRYVEPGDDPLRSLVGLLSGAGIDIEPSDVAWAGGFDP